MASRTGDLVHLSAVTDRSLESRSRQRNRSWRNRGRFRVDCGLGVGGELGLSCRFNFSVVCIVEFCIVGVVARCCVAQLDRGHRWRGHRSQCWQGRESNRGWFGCRDCCGIERNRRRHVNNGRDGRWCRCGIDQGSFDCYRFVRSTSRQRCDCDRKNGHQDRDLAHQLHPSEANQLR